MSARNAVAGGRCLAADCVALGWGPAGACCCRLRTPHHSAIVVHAWQQVNVRLLPCPALHQCSAQGSCTHSELLCAADRLLLPPALPQVQANALAVAGGEDYYRNMFFGDDLTWNLRDGHFLEALQLVDSHLRWVGDGGVGVRTE
jgi:hypothetical protein